MLYLIVHGNQYHTLYLRFTLLCPWWPGAYNSGFSTDWGACAGIA
uniref:Uncharacterized protein n=1 Tax=Ralstonia solanacearum TaxID=305 RepID=A0A0S4X3X5_RALSL|nr:protein of unknown function [Ralstonia solanacearum]